MHSPFGLIKLERAVGAPLSQSPHRLTVFGANLMLRNSEQGIRFRSTARFGYDKLGGASRLWFTLINISCTANNERHH
jgi:hypothetical protein